jgi:hypothetical protein
MKITTIQAYPVTKNNSKFVLQAKTMCSSENVKSSQLNMANISSSDHHDQFPAFSETTLTHENSSPGQLQMHENQDVTPSQQ